MKRKLLFKSVLFAGLSLLAFEANAQDSDKEVKQKVIDKKGKPTLIIFKDKSNFSANDSKKLFKEQLKLDEHSKFSNVKTESDKSGFSHKKYQQYYDGVKVEFATYSLHSKGDHLESMSGEYYNIEGVETTPSLSKDVAFKKALQHIGAKSYLWEDPESAAKIGYEKPEGELVLLPALEEQEDSKKKSKEEARLAYKFDIYATNPVSRGDLYIDAKNGRALFYNATIKHLGKFSHSSNSAENKNVSEPSAKIYAGYSKCGYSLQRNSIYSNCRKRLFLYTF